MLPQPEGLSQLHALVTKSHLDVIIYIVRDMMSERFLSGFLILINFLIFSALMNVPKTLIGYRKVE